MSKTGKKGIFTVILILVAGLSLYLLRVVANEERTRREDALALDEALRVAARLYDWEAQNSLKSVPLGPLQRSLAREQTYSPYPFIEFAFGNAVDVEVDPRRTIVKRILRHFPKSPQQEPRRPSWTELNARKMARSALMAIRGHDSDLAEPQVQFVNHRNGKILSDRAYWEFCWHRRTSDGISFQTECVSLYLDEEQGVDFYAEDFWSELVEPPASAKRKKPEELKHLAFAWAEQSAKKVFGSDAVLGASVGSYLQVVTPNTFISKGEYSDRFHDWIWAGRSKRAWVAYYRLTENWNSLRGVILVYIDPYTGEYLGGDESLVIVGSK